MSFMQDAIDTTDGKVKLNVGCGRNILKGWVNLDSVAAAGVDIIRNLEDCCKDRIPYPANMVDEFLLSHIIEHIHKPLPLMQELHRVAKPGALMIIRTPYGSSDDAWADPTHVRPYFLTSFHYFGQPFYWKADYGYRGDWRVKHINLFVVDGITQLSEVRTMRNVVVEMVAMLEAVKPIRECKQELMEEISISIKPA